MTLWMVKQNEAYMSIQNLIELMGTVINVFVWGNLISIRQSSRHSDGHVEATFAKCFLIRPGLWNCSYRTDSTELCTGHS
jgi:hypothetical protein